MKTNEVGTRIRIARKNSGLTLEQLAEKVGVSTITFQRYETGRSSPSVVLLTEIASAVNRPIFSFFEPEREPFVCLKRKNQRSISTPMLNVKVIGPRNMIADNIVGTYGELKKGKSIVPHTNNGIEYNYTIEGKCELKVNGQSYFLEVGYSSVFDARNEHSVTALEKLKFFGIYIEDKP